MNQFGKILKFELKNYAKNKAFVGITLFLMVVIAIVMFFPRIAASFESDAPSDATADRSVMLVKADDPARADMVKETFAAAFVDYNVQMTDEELDTIKGKITSGDVACAFVMNDATSFTYYVDNLSMYDMNPDIATEVLQQVYQMN
ncbi:MAG: hypothetical protein IKV35_00485, partial [Clostridia bacterium]|nr:hypothetical protein [Clostridia bacterium]